MAYAGFQASKIQFGREATAGTAVAATVIWRGAFANLEDARTRTTVDEQIGLMVQAERTYDSAYLGRLTMPGSPLTFEQVPHILEAGVGTVSPSGADPYVYTYTMPTGSTPNTLKTYTMEAYNALVTGDYREMEYCFVEEFTFSFSGDEAWQVSANWLGRQLSTGTATSLSTLQSVNEALGRRTKLYIDATGGTLGSTQKTGVLMGANMTVRTGWQPVPVGDGNLYFSGVKYTHPEITFSMTLELEDSSVVADERAIYESNAVRLFRWEMDGADADHEMKIDFAGVYDSIGQYENSDGNTTVTLEGHGVYSSTDSEYWEAAVTNSLSSLP
jgi:hypothetical protein